ncbi:MAG: Uncharacterized protein JWM80_168, partial [Cyanobacteria bacterium RYN_339]|nr:Uncharacterized protein [Cyanobacteria bacterium RYN_339]
TDAGDQPVWHVKAVYDRSTYDLQLSVMDGEQSLYEVRTAGGRDLLRYTPMGSDSEYPVTGEGGRALGNFKRRGGLSGAWQAQYEWLDAGGEVLLTFTQENPAAAIANTFVQAIPLVGDLVAAAVLNPTYAISLPDGTMVRRLNTGRFLLVPTYTLDHVADVPSDLAPFAVLGAMLMVLQENSRS